VRFEEFCDPLGAAYGMGLIAAGGSGGLNAVDRLFEERVGWFWPLLGEPGREAADPVPEPWEALLERVYRGLEAERDRRDRSVDELAERMERHTLRRDGETLTYFATGSGSVPVVLVNALGQGLRFWHRLIHALAPRHRVIVWEARGTTDPPRPFGIDEQARDVEAVLCDQEIERCHLVGWCTGPKVALRFARSHPGKVASLAFLNSTFKCGGSPPEAVTEYENNIESLLRMVAERPGMAGPLMRALQSTLQQGEIDLAGSDAEGCALEVLSRANVRLRHEVLGPFRDERSTLNYARQLVDFVAYDALEDAAGLRLPMLVISADHDRVSAPEMSRVAAGVFGESRFLRVRGASHYCLYDRPEFVAGLLETFFADETRLPGAPGEIADVT
jgi:pimeloyl-ACP methyl ester carboxylesterase